MQRGFTLVEMLVVLVLLGLAAALVAPAMVPARHSETSEFQSLVAAARDAALRRGEVMWLRVDRRGAWRLEGTASTLEDVVAQGRLTSLPPAGDFTLVISPLGSCAFDVRSGNAARSIAIEPLTCEVRS